MLISNFLASSICFKPKFIKYIITIQAATVKTTLNNSNGAFIGKSQNQCNTKGIAQTSRNLLSFKCFLSNLSKPLTYIRAPPSIVAHATCITGARIPRALITRNIVSNPLLIPYLKIYPAVSNAPNPAPTAAPISSPFKM